jgi:hypothetical protein
MSSHPVPGIWWLNPFCHYCGRRVKKATTATQHHADTGTVEHIPPKWIARMMGVPCEKVLACYACNARENERAQEMFPGYFLQLWNGGSIPCKRRMLTMKREIT